MKGTIRRTLVALMTSAAAAALAQPASGQTAPPQTVEPAQQAGSAGIDDNLDAVFLGTRAAVRHMKVRGGAIVNLSSIEGIVGNPHVPAYNASKGGVRLLTKSAALHCARAGYPIRINSLHPGYVATPMVIEALPFVPDDFAEKARERTPMGRFGEAAEIARAVVFLASEDASYMTGAELVVDGGYTA